MFSLGASYKRHLISPAAQRVQTILKTSENFCSFYMLVFMNTFSFTFQVTRYKPFSWYSTLLIIDNTMN